MKNTLKYLFLFLMITRIYASIESTDPISYTSIADSYIQNRNFEEANKYINIAKIYSTYDLFRLKDSSAIRKGNPQTPIWNAIEPWVIAHPIEYKNGLIEALDFVNKNPPNHTPKWITENSLSTIIGNEPLIEKQKWEEVWKKTIKSFEKIAYNDKYWENIQNIIKKEPQKILSGYAYKILSEIKEPKDLKEKYDATILASYKTEKFGKEELQRSIQLIKFMQMQWITKQ